MYRVAALERGIRADLRTYVRAGASILHADLDAFFASVEQRDRPGLRGRPVIVGDRRGARSELRGEGARRPDRDGRRPRASALPRRGRRAAADVGVLGGEQGRLPRLRGHVAARRGHCRSTRRSSTCAGWSAPSGLRPRSRRGSAHAVRDRVGLPITVGVARTKFLAKVASGVAKPDGLLVVPPDRELAFLHPLPVERLWGVGAGDGAEAPRPRRSRRCARSRSCPRALLVSMLGPAPAGTCTRSRTTSTPGRCRRGAGAARSARSVRAACGRWTLARASTPTSSRSSTGSRGGCGPRTAWPHGRPPRCASTTSRAPRARKRCRARRATAHDARRRARAAARGALPMLEARGLTLVGIVAHEPRRRDTLQLALPLEDGDRSASRCRGRRGARALRRRRGHARRAPRPARGVTMPLLPD